MSDTKIDTGLTVDTGLTIWEALFCPCTFESSFGRISLHYSEEGAAAAVTKHRKKHMKDWSYSSKTLPDWVKWDVVAVVVQP
jgi:hypothetical protein